MKGITFGVFDLLHAGHINLFKKCKKQCDELQVMVQSDKGVFKYKPEAKLIYDQDQRAEFIKVIQYVDKIDIYEDIYPEIKNQEFDILFLGEDQVHKGFSDAVDWCKKNNKMVVRLERTAGVSSTIKRLESVTSTYGGWWRYPELKDYYYLVNPYFPSSKLLNQLKSSYEMLLTQYPSGLSVQKALAGNLFNVNPSNISVGNGAAELISQVAKKYRGKKVAVLTPSFAEYENRFLQQGCQLIKYDTSIDDYQLVLRNLIEFLSNNKPDLFLLVSPDNPSGASLSNKDIISLSTHCKCIGCHFILDESFVDFSSNSSTLIPELTDHNISIIKSISKSFGVPGLRLGILASNDSDLINYVDKELPIWNINSFAEYFLQIMPNYLSDYTGAMKHHNEVRDTMYKNLVSSGTGIKVYPSDANYFLVRLDRMESSRFCELMFKGGYIVKDLKSKMGGNYIRLSVRTDEENYNMITYMRSILL